MPEARVQLAIEIETEGAEQLTALRRELTQLGEVGSAALARLDASLTAVLDRLQQSRELLATSTRDFLQSHRQLFSSLEPFFDTFFRRLLAGARNFRDTFKRLLADLLDFFLRTVAQMLAGWLSAFRQMSSSSGGGRFFGLLAPLLSSGFGFRLGPGGTPPTFPTAGGGGISATNVALLSRLGINLRNLGPIPGGALLGTGLLGVLLGFSRGSRVLGTLGGAAAGFAFGGPVGAAIGAVVGFFAGLFGRGRLKRQAAQAEQAFAQQLVQVLNAFKRFQIDHQSAVAAVAQAWAAFQQSAPAQFGFAGRRAVTNIAPFVTSIFQELNRIQRARQRRQQIIESLPIPEFQRGGLVDQVAAQLSTLGPRSIQSTNGRLLAFLHPGEAVLNRQAVQRLGPRFIEHANRTPASNPSAAATGNLRGSTKIEIHIHPAPGMNEEQLADFTIRKLRRQLRDQGLTLG